MQIFILAFHLIVTDVFLINHDDETARVYQTQEECNMKAEQLGAGLHAIPVQGMREIGEYVCMQATLQK